MGEEAVDGRFDKGGHFHACGEEFTHAGIRVVVVARAGGGGPENIAEESDMATGLL